MKCVHCSHRLTRADWFCPNCKRSAVTTHTAQRRQWGAAVAGIGLGVVAGCLALSRLTAHHVRPTAVDNTPIVTLRELPSRPQPQPAEEPPVETQPEASKPASKPAPVHQPVAAATSPVPPSGGAPGSVSVLTEPPVATYVYLNGGSLLGQTPLRNVTVPAGRQTLVFWSPSVGGRSRRTVDVVSGEATLVVEPVRAQPQFADGTGG